MGVDADRCVDVVMGAHEHSLLFFLIYFYLFIFGCVGSSFLCEGFL